MDRLFINIQIDSCLKFGSPPGEHQQGINGLLGFWSRTGNSRTASQILSFPELSNGRWFCNPGGYRLPYIQNNNKPDQASISSFYWTSSSWQQISTLPVSWPYLMASLYYSLLVPDCL
jgi:hypothetical protein